VCRRFPQFLRRRGDCSALIDRDRHGLATARGLELGRVVGFQVSPGSGPGFQRACKKRVPPRLPEKGR